MFDQYRKAKLIAASYTCQRAPDREATMKFQSIICIQKQKKFHVNRNMCFQGFPRRKTFSCNCINKSQRLKPISMFPLTKQNKTEQQIKTSGK